MSSRSIFSFVRRFISRSRCYSCTSLVSRTLILRNLISKPCCAISITPASSKSLASENDKMKRGDEILLRVLKSQIAEKELKNVLPKDFQFEIINEEGLITLKREYDGEQIQAEVVMDSESANITLLVAIDKKMGHTLHFWCNLTPNDFEIESMSLASSENYDGDNHYLFCSDERLQSAFQEYLAARGINNSLYDYLHYRMDPKYFIWQNLKELIEK